MRWLAFCLPLAGCVSVLPAVQPLLVESSPAVPPAPPAAVPPAPAVAAVTQEYHAARSQELRKVLAPDVSADTVTKIHVADLEARSALSRLESQGRHYTAAALAAARDAVRRLITVLEGAP